MCCLAALEDLAHLEWLKIDLASELSAHVWFTFVLLPLSPGGRIRWQYA